MEYFKNRHIPFYYLYDTRGSELYNEITQLTEYYPYRKEEEILLNYASEILAFKDDLKTEGITLVEFGAGYSLKTEIIIKELLSKYSNVIFVPIDVSESACEYSSKKYNCFTNLKVEPFVGTYESYLNANINYNNRVIYLWLGSSIGNLPEIEQIEFLNKFSASMTYRDVLLIGFDSVYKPKKVIYEAYNDSKGVTAKFIMNIIPHLKNKYNLNINEDDFEYDGSWNEEFSRMEMNLKCIKNTLVSDLENKIEEEIKAGEKIFVEYSHKFSSEYLEKLSNASNLTLSKIWFTDDKYFMFGVFLKSLLPLWERTNFIFQNLLGYENLHTQPIDLRNPFVFYLGHIYTFYDIKVFNLNENDKFFQLFERGRDPLVESPENCHRHSSVVKFSSYPHYTQILKYNEKIKEKLINQIKEEGYSFNLLCSVEHEIMHQETLMYMIRMTECNLPVSIPSEYSFHEKKIIKIPKRNISQGTNETFTWDNERPKHVIEVDEFKVDSHPVTWKEFKEFLDVHPDLLSKIINLNQDFQVRVSSSVWVDFEKAKDLPAWVSLNVAKSFTEWKSKSGTRCRIITENEYDSLLSQLKDFKKGNLNFKNFHAMPVGFFNDVSDDGVYELMGNGWELTNSLFRPFQGFQQMQIYNEYSKDFFTDSHYVLKGAGPFTDQTLCRGSFRNWYQHNYVYQTSKFRLVYY
jgi:L-histidine Nalpha-methyltransferase / hercynylcysteine S-oxide synthase